MALGHVSGPHGVRGEVVIKPYTQEPEGVATYGAVTDESGDREFKVKVVRVTKKGVVARLSGISNRNEAEALKGLVLFVEKSKLPKEDEDEWYFSDLIDLKVFLKGEKNSKGAVVAVQNYGAADLLEVRIEGAKTTLLVPFTEEIVPEVNVAEGFVVIDPPDGLLN